MLVFDLATGELAEVVEAADICGVAACDGGFASSTGEGLLLSGGESVRLPALAFDNRVVRIAAA
jgi:hypothetical protein